MNILYVAFPCNPYNGSESKIGWNIPLENSKYNNVTVVTIKDMKKDIEDYIHKNGDVNIDFYYVDLPKFVKKYLKKLSTIKLKLYHRLVYKLIKNKILKRKEIDIIHQITPVEFRSIGNYYKFKNVKFIVGPIGGGEYIPPSLSLYAQKYSIIEHIRRVLNLYSKIQLKLNIRKMKETNIIYANRETKDYLNIKYKMDTILPEVGVRNDELLSSFSLENHSKIITFIVSGRLIYRKGHEFLLDTLKTVPEKYNYIVKIVGDGKERSKLENMVDADSNLKKHVKFVGNIDFRQMDYEYRSADVLIMPSLRETTGSVVLEAMARGVSVITIDKFGAKEIVNETNGYLYDGNNREEQIASLRKCIITCLEDKELLNSKMEKSYEQANNFLFSQKVIYYNEIYNKMLENN